MSETPLDFIDFESDAEEIENEDGSVDILFEDSETDFGFTATDHYENLAERMSDEDLKQLGQDVCDAYESDLASRSEWEMITIEALENLGIEYIEASEPFDGACTATHPLILENSIKFQSKAAIELLPDSGPVKTKILGQKTEELEDRAKRVRQDMNYTVQHGIPEYYDETDRALFFQAFLGNAFKKKSWGAEKRRITDEFVLPDRLIVNNNAKSLMTAERISFKDYLSQRRVESLMDAGFFRDLPLGKHTEAEGGLGEPYSPTWTEFEQKIREIQGIDCSPRSFSDIYEIIEQHVYLRIAEDTAELSDVSQMRPFIVTVEKTTGTVLSVYRNWSENDPNEERLEWFSHYVFVPTAGFLGWGYSHLLGNLNRAITLSMRSLADAGQFANLPAGFKSENARILDDGAAIGPGEFRNVEIPTVTQNIRDLFMELPFKEPSQTLFAMMQSLEATGQKFADSTEQVIADSTNYGPVGTTMALLEASTRFFASVYKRAYRAQAHEFKIIARLIHDYYPDSYEIIFDPEQEFSRTEDYDPSTIDIVPVSSPNYSSQAQRISKAQVLLDTALKAPSQHDMEEVLKEFYKAFELDDIDKVLPPKEQPQMQDPLSDIFSALKGKPIAAFKGQDHESHIAVKSAWLQDPSIGGSEQMQAIVPVISANIQEHMFQMYVSQMEAVMAQEQVSMAQAAQRISRLNQIAIEEQQKGSPAYILAMAEDKKATADLMREQREAQNDRAKVGLDLLRIATDAEELALKAAESGHKINMEQFKVAADLIKAGAQDIRQGEANANKTNN